ncbi:MFS transporter [Uliginosibacterium paludis]|uniref:MFS transporter n=1 Tax=Uliginosibacterium paludis TaxID=1615952 RepID=A0ABV2CVR9_9RHOO
MSLSPRPFPSADAADFGRFVRISVALFMAGFATFSLLYCTQPLLPEFAAEFRLSPAGSSLALSLSTACLAFAILCVGALSESIGRRRLMFCSICLAALLNLLAAVSPGWGWLLAARALEGLALGGVPAVAMAYLAEETPSRRLGLAMGLYVAGTAFGGMTGRVAIGFLAAHAGWREAMAGVALTGFLLATGFVLLLPPSRHFVRRTGLGLDFHLKAWRRHLLHPQLPALFMIGFLAMGVFVTLYNYIGFRLVGEPWHLNHAQIGLIFMAYLSGMAASPLAGALADRWGRAAVALGGSVVMLAGMLLTLSSTLPRIICGITLLTAGFFATHSVASAWVGRLAESHKGHASSLYLLGYYLGSSVLGSLGGWFWAEGGWGGVVYSGTALILVVVLLTFYLRNEESSLTP